MRTEVKLNSIYYKLANNRLPVQTLANQMASKVGQGASEYGDLTTWSAWIQEDWQDGIGKIKPHRNGGMLYGEADSRVPGQLILPPRMKSVDNDAAGSSNTRYWNPDLTVGMVPVGGASIQRLAVNFTTPSSGILSSSKFWIYASIPPGVTLTFAIYTGSSPTTLVTSTTYNAPEENYGLYWHGVSMTTSGLSTSTTYSLVVYPDTSTFNWAYGTGNSSSVTDAYNGSSWGVLGSPYTGADPLFITNIDPLSTSTTNSGAGFFRFNNILYCYSNNRVWEYSTSNSQWDLVNTITGITNVTGATVFDSTVYFGNKGGDGDYTTMNTSEAFTDTGADGVIFAKWKGRLWRAVANYVEYSNDGTTWEPTATITGEPIYVSDTSDPVTGMCGMGNIMYVATTAGLVPIQNGDVITGGYTWGSYDAQNGMRMVEFEGAIYATVNGRIMRFTEDGSMQDVWLTRDDDILAGRLGKVWDLEKVNNWLFALVGSTDATGKPTIWAYQNNSWHHVGSLPNSYSSVSDIYKDYDLFYDRPTQKLWVITPDFLTFYFYIPDYTLNPFNDSSSTYANTAWVEWDWFDGAVLEAYKDYDSVTIMGENLSATCCVIVYWKDDASTTWEYLGTATSNIQELRWTLTGGSRPNTKRLKLAMLLITYDSTETPRIRAFRVKYHLMVRDWFRWNLQIDVSGRSGALAMTADGTRHTLTAGQIKDNIDALCKQVPPFVYQDVDGNQYEVKITDGNFTYTKYEYVEATTTEWWEGVYNLVLEQVTQGEYSA